MKTLIYLFSSCFGNEEMPNKLEEKKGILEREKNSLLMAGAFKGPSLKYMPMEFGQSELYFSNRTGKEIDRSEKLREINEDIAVIEKNISKM